MKKISGRTGYNATFDVRIYKDYRHMTPVTLCGNINFAVDIMDCNKSANYLDRINETYKSTGYLPIPIIIENISDHFNDMSDTYYTLRYWLHNPDIKNLIIYNPVQKQYYMCSLDSDAYDFKGQSTDIGRNNVFVMPFNLSDLSISDCGFYVPGFENAYNEWKHTKRLKLEDLFIQEQNEAAIKAKIEAEQKEALLKKEQEALERKQRKQLESRQLLISEGMFEDTIDGKTVKSKIEDVTIKRGAMRYSKNFSDDEILEKMNKIFNGDVSALKNMLNIMSSPYQNEKAIFKKIYNDYFSRYDNGAVEDRVRLRVLEHIKTFTQLSF